VKGDRLLPGHHVARHCRRNDLTWSGNTATGVLEGAFDPDADGVSVTWLEFFQGDRQQRMLEVRQALLSHLTPKASNRLAILNVGKIEAAGNAVGTHVVEDPFMDPPPGNPAHALIKETSGLQDVKVREALASTVDANEIETY
jgi:hypothetical protein